MRAFGCGDELNHFFGSAEPVLDHVRVSAKGFRGESGGNARFGEACGFGKEKNLVHTNSRDIFLSEMRLKTFGECSTARAGFHEGLHKVRKVILSDSGTEADACDT